jgi:hypothetical protein
MAMDPLRDQAWLNADEYPDEKDIEEFGDVSPADYDPLTIGYYGKSRPSFWTSKRIILLIVGLILIAALLLPFLPRLL